MVETRHGSRTDGAGGETTNPTNPTKSTKTAKAETPRKTGTTDSREEAASEMKTEPTDVQASVEEGLDDANARAGDKHDRSRSPDDERKRQKKAESAEDKIKSDKQHVKKEDEQDHKKKKDDEPTVLEKGNIYFFFRARVNIDDPQSLDDVARTYIVLKPQPKTEAAGGSTGHCRLLALPKKVLPRTGRDRFMAFVLKADASYSELENEFLMGSEPESQANGGDDAKDQGEKHYPAATAFGEGVYAIIGTGRESHLAYVLSVPETLGAVQKQLGLVNKQGCFIVSAKNPAFPMPGGAKMVGGGPDYPKE